MQCEHKKPLSPVLPDSRQLRSLRLVSGGAGASSAKMKNIETNNGAASRAAQTTTEIRIADRWLRQLYGKVARLRGKRAGDSPLMSITLDHDVVKLLNQLARRIVKRTGAELWQAKSAIIVTAFEMLFSPGARDL